MRFQKNLHMALGHISPIHRNLEKEIKIEAPRKPLWTWARFCVNLGMILASLGSRNADIFLAFGNIQAALRPKRVMG